MTSEEGHVPKAVLYYNPQSVWSAVALLGIHEKGYGTDEVDLRIVDLAHGENYNPAFLRLNPKGTRDTRSSPDRILKLISGTVPTLVVPLQKTLSEDVESRYKAITDSKAIAEFLDKSRSSQSRTHTTSDAPAPTLTPATIEFMEKSNEIIELLHSEVADPNNLWYLNARDAETLRKHSVEVLPVLTGRVEALTQFLESEEIHVSEKTKQFWVEKKARVEAQLDVFLLADKMDNELSETDSAKRQGYFTAGTNAWAGIKEVLQKLDKAVIGPYALGDQISIADLHLAAWLARVVRLAGGSAGDDGKTVVKKLGDAIGEERTEERRTKVGTYWEKMGERDSWKKVF